MIQIFDARTGGSLLTLNDEQSRWIAHSVIFSLDGKQIAAASFINGDLSIVQFWDATTGADLRTTLKLDYCVNHLAYSYDCKWLAGTGEADGRWKISLSCATDKETSIHSECDGRSVALAFCPDGESLVSATAVDNKLLATYQSFPSGKVTRKSYVDNFNDSPRLEDVVFSRDCRLLAGARNYRNATFAAPGNYRPPGCVEPAPPPFVQVWSLETGDEIFAGRGHCSSGAISVAFSPDGTRLASCGCYDGKAVLWEISTGRELLKVNHAESSTGIRAVFSPDGTRLATIGRPGIAIWDLSTGDRVVSVPFDVHWFNGFAFSPDGKRFVLSHG